MPKELATTAEQHAEAIQWNDDKIDLVRSTIMDSKANTNEANLFAHICQQTGLDPFSRQIYALRLKGNKLSFLTSVDGFRVVAQRSKDYAGQDGPHWCGDDGVWKDVWLETSPPRAAKVGVFRKGFEQAIYAVARFDEYKGNSPIWGKMPALMIAKCAECLALRRAFPNDLSGIYGEDEMDQARKEVENEVRDATEGPKEGVATQTGDANKDLTAVLENREPDMGEVTPQEPEMAAEAVTGDVVNPDGEVAAPEMSAIDKDIARRTDLMEAAGITAKEATEAKPSAGLIVKILVARGYDLPKIKENCKIHFKMKYKADKFGDLKAAEQRQAVKDALEGEIDDPLPF